MWEYVDDADGLNLSNQAMNDDLSEIEEDGDLSNIVLENIEEEIDYKDAPDLPEFA